MVLFQRGAASFAAAGVAWALFVGSALAEEQPQAVSEVVVIGERPTDKASAGSKSDIPLIETPQSISVIGRSQLDLQNITNLNQALRYTAGVEPDTRGNTAGRYDQFNIRGFLPEQYLDGLRLIRNNAGYDVPQIDITRLDRIEVVKGPASVLYGQSSPGGLVALTSKLPTAKPFGQVEVLGGSFAFAQVDVDTGGPVDKDGHILFRVNGEAAHTNTEIAHTQSERIGISPALTFKPNDRATWTVLYTFQRDPEGGAYGSVPLQGSLLPNPRGRIARDFNNSEPSYDRFKRDEHSVTSLFSYQLADGWSVQSNARYTRVTSYYRSTSSGAINADSVTVSRRSIRTDEGLNNLTLDNRLVGHLTTGPITHDVLVGADYQHTGQNELAGLGAAPPINVFAPVYGVRLIDGPTVINMHLTQEQAGAYAQDQISLDRFRLLLSGREDSVDSSQFNKIAKTTSTFSQSKLTGRAGLLYLFDNGVAPYVSYATSFLPQTATDAQGNVLAPTQGKQVEVGVKYQPKIWDTLLTLSVYDLRETNVATADPVTPRFSIATGEIRSKGVELEGRTHPFPELEVNGAYTYLDNKVVRDNTAARGTRPYGIPQQVGSLFGVYTWAGGALNGAGLGGGVRYLGQSFNGANGPLLHKIPDATLFDLVATYDLSHLRSTLKGLTLDVNARNLFDARFISACLGQTACIYGAGRNVQAALRYRW